MTQTFYKRLTYDLKNIVGWLAGLLLRFGGGRGGGELCDDGSYTLRDFFDFRGLTPYAK